jgi:hypothetical protein
LGYLLTSHHHEKGLTTEIPRIVAKSEKNLNTAKCIYSTTVSIFDARQLVIGECLTDAHNCISHFVQILQPASVRAVTNITISFPQ